MIYLALIFATIALFAGFLGLTIVEARSGTRVLAKGRHNLDRTVARVAFVAKHVDWGSFFKNALQSAFERIVHDIAQFTLLCVRFIERELTGLIRSLRTRRPNMLAPKPSRTPARIQVSRFVRRYLRILSKKQKREETL